MINKRAAFSEYHPAVNLVFFLPAVIFPMVISHPVFLAVSFTAAFIYAVIIRGAGAVKFAALFCLPLFLMIALINPLFSHKGGDGIIFILQIIP